MIVPVGIENAQLRGVPVVTLGAVVLAIVVFLVTGPAVPIVWLSLVVSIGLLLLAGPWVEDALGRGRFVLLLLAGGALELFTAAPMPIGGALAACMGAFCFRFARRFLSVFYWLVVSGTFAVPAWVLGVVWFGQDILMQLAGGSMVTSFVHTAAFAMGTAMALASPEPARATVRTAPRPLPPRMEDEPAPAPFPRFEPVEQEDEESDHGGIVAEPRVRSGLIVPEPVEPASKEPQPLVAPPMLPDDAGLSTWDEAATRIARPSELAKLLRPVKPPKD